MDTIQIINDIKQKLIGCNKDTEYFIQDLDFLTSKFSSLEKIATKEEFDFSFMELNKILEKCYSNNNISQYIFLLRKEVISIENAFSDNPSFRKDIYTQMQRIENLNDHTDVNTFSEILNIIKLFLPILRNKNEELEKNIAKKIQQAEIFIKEKHINDQNLKEYFEEIRTNFIDIRNKIKGYFEENPNAKKVALGAGAIGLGVLGFMVGKELYKTFRQPKIAINDDTLIVAYYLSRFDHINLFDEYIPASQAFEVISKVLDVKTNTLRSMRDYFDAIIENKKTNRKGYANSKIPQKYYTLQVKNENRNEQEIKKDVLQILNKAD